MRNCEIAKLRNCEIAPWRGHCRRDGSKRRGTPCSSAGPSLHCWPTLCRWRPGPRARRAAASCLARPRSAARIRTRPRRRRGRSRRRAGPDECLTPEFKKKKTITLDIKNFIRWWMRAGQPIKCNNNIAFIILILTIKHYKIENIRNSFNGEQNKTEDQS